MGARCVCPLAVTRRSFGSAVTRYFSWTLGRATVVESASPLVLKGRWNSNRDAEGEISVLETTRYTHLFSNYFWLRGNE